MSSLKDGEGMGRSRDFGGCYNSAGDRGCHQRGPASTPHMFVLLIHYSGMGLGGEGQLKCRKALGLIWSSIPPEEGAPFSAQRFCPPINCVGDVFLNFAKAVP